MKITDLKENEGILCPTIEIFEKIIKLNKKNDITINNLLINKDIVYYPFIRDNKGIWSSLQYAKEKGYKIYKASKFLKPSLKNRVKKLEKKLIQTKGELRCLKTSFKELEGGIKDLSKAIFNIIDDTTKEIFEKEEQNRFDLFKQIKKTSTDFKPELPQVFYDFENLLTLRNQVRAGWMPDWDNGIFKHCIIFRRNEIELVPNSRISYPLSFRYKEDAEKFLKANEELILKCKDLLG